MARGLLSCGAVVFRLDGPAPRCLLLRAWRNWDFPKGVMEPGEGPWETAAREVAEESGLTALDWPVGDEYRETVPYAGGKIARYYLAVTADPRARLPVNPQLGRPEHHEFRWVDCVAATALLPARLQPVLAWACARIASLYTP